MDPSGAVPVAAEAALDHLQLHFGGGSWNRDLAEDPEAPVGLLVHAAGPEGHGQPGLFGHAGFGTEPLAVG